MEVIVWDIRLPIALMAVLVGAMLGAAGAEMQTILNNPLADPFTLGISLAASLREVWYFVDRPAVRRLLKDITTGYGLFRIHDWGPAA